MIKFELGAVAAFYLCRPFGMELVRLLNETLILDLRSRLMGCPRPSHPGGRDD